MAKSIPWRFLLTDHHTRAPKADLLGTCAELPGSALTFPFGPDTPVFKVGGKMFALLSGVDPQVDPDRVSLKCEPEYAADLVRQHEEIIPGYHLNKRHWITVDLRGALPAELINDLVVDSYDLVVDRLPRSSRPGTPGR